jgi:colanic acid/amylovoran biosynthesis protein
MKIIEIRGVEFVNKGAELMLLAIKEQLLNKYGNDIILVMEKGKRVPEHKLRENGIYTKLDFQRFKIDFKKFGSVIPKFLRRKFNYILEEEVEIVLDGSGFAYGDQWGAKYGNKRLASNITKLKKAKKKIILLPQAFGPFMDKSTAKMMIKIIENSQLIFAREEKSLNYLKQLETSNDHIYQAPDFTNLIKGKQASNFDSKKLNVAVIPNYKMIEKSEDNGKAYKIFLIEMVNYLKEKNFKPYFLIHEGKKDFKIAQNLNEQLGNAIPIIDPKDALIIKGIIGSAEFTISSRFHGAISSISQSVPCIITSWSHKYKFLAKEYNCEDFVIDNMGEFDKAKKIIDSLSNSTELKFQKDNLFKMAAIYKKKSVKMWDKVFEIIN